MTEREHQLSILIGEMIRAARDELKLSQEEVAELAEFNRAEVDR